MTVKHLVHERIGRGKELEVGNLIKTRSPDPHLIDRYTRNQIPWSATNRSLHKNLCIAIYRVRIKESGFNQSGLLEILSIRREEPNDWLHVFSPNYIYSFSLCQKSLCTRSSLVIIKCFLALITTSRAHNVDNLLLLGVAAVCRTWCYVSHALRVWIWSKPGLGLHV